MWKKLLFTVVGTSAILVGCNNDNNDNGLNEETPMGEPATENSRNLNNDNIDNGNVKDGVNNRMNDNEPNTRNNNDNYPDTNGNNDNYPDINGNNEDNYPDINGNDGDNYSNEDRNNTGSGANTQSLP